MLRTVVATVCLCSFDIAIAAPVQLTGQSLSEMIAGAVVELDTPLGTKLSITYGDDGRMTGRAGALAFHLGASRDNGKWWVTSDQLCQKWETWFKTETQCMRIKKEGPRIHWASRDGKTGTGTVQLRVAAAPDATRVKPNPVSAKVVAIVAPPSAKPRPPVVSTLPSPRKETLVETTTDVAPQTASLIVAPVPAPAVQARPQFSRLTVPFFAADAIAKSPELSASADDATSANSTAPPTATTTAGIETAVTATGTASAVEAQRKADPKPVPKNAVKPTLPPAAHQASIVPPEPMFKVVNVRVSDVLNVRKGPSEDHDVVGAIPSRGRGVAVTGDCRSQWCPVPHLELRGWVNKNYLEGESGDIVVYSDRVSATSTDSPDAPRGCLSSAAKELLGRIEAKFGRMQLVSTCRSGAVIGGTGRPSRHRDGNAIDFKAGARKQAVVDWLVANHAQGGTMTYRDMDHIHIDIGPHFVALGSGGRSGRDWSAGRMGVTSAR
jgi:hypothetical protein